MNHRAYHSLSLCFISLISLFGCLQIPPGKAKVRILKINQYALREYCLFEVETRKADTIILISRQTEQKFSCGRRVFVGQEYSLDLEAVNPQLIYDSHNRESDIHIRGHYGIFLNSGIVNPENGILVNLNSKVYLAKNLLGDCIIQ